MRKGTRETTCGGLRSLASSALSKDYTLSPSELSERPAETNSGFHLVHTLKASYNDANYLSTEYIIIETTHSPNLYYIAPLTFVLLYF